MSWFNDDLDRIDASVFNSDALGSFDNRKELKAMCERWLRAIEAHESQPCDSCGYQHGHQIGCEQNPVDIKLRASAYRNADNGVYGPEYQHQDSSTYLARAEAVLLEPRASDIEPMLLRDLAQELDVNVPWLCEAIAAQGLGHFSVNMAVTREVAQTMRKLRGTLPSPTTPTQRG